MARLSKLQILTSLILCSCGGDSSSKAPADTEKKTVSDVSTEVLLEITEGPMKGSSATFPPGSLAEGDVLTIAIVTEQPAELAAVFSGGITQASPSGIAVSITDESGKAKDLEVPGTLSIALNEGLELTADAARKNVGVLSKSNEGALVAYLAKYAQPAEGKDFASVMVNTSGTYTAAFIGDEAPEGFSVYDMEAPTLASDTIVASEVTATTLSLTWTKATDDSTAEADLSYKVFRSAEDNLTSVQDTLDNGTELNEWTKDIGTLAVTQLTASTTYYFNILVKDDKEKMTAYKTLTQETAAAASSSDQVQELPDISSPIVSPLRIFATSSIYDGNLGGVTGADQKCQTDGANPNPGAAWKAFLVEDGVRIACSVANCAAGSVPMDWVLQADTQYVRASDSAPIGTTNVDGIFTFPLMVSMNGPDDTPYWTGFGSTSDWLLDNAQTCTNWTSASGNGSTGQGDTVAATTMHNADMVSCASQLLLLCVEQPAP